MPTDEEYEVEEEVTKLYQVKVTAEWTFEIEALDEQDAEYEAEGLANETQWDYIDCWAEEISND